MDFKKLENDVVKNVERYAKSHNVKIGEEFAILKLQEELGEFAQSLLIHKKNCRPEKYLDESQSKRELTNELADVFCMVVYLAHVLDVDLEEGLEEVCFSRLRKAGLKK